MYKRQIYFLVRIVGKYLGSTLGALVTNATPEIKKYFGLALIPQAGVSIGLAVLGQRMLPAASGEMLSTIILSSGILYEMVGPACAKAAIRLSGSIPAKKAEKMCIRDSDTLEQERTDDNVGNGRLVDRSAADQDSGNRGKGHTCLLYTS